MAQVIRNGMHSPDMYQGEFSKPETQKTILNELATPKPEVQPTEERAQLYETMFAEDCARLRDLRYLQDGDPIPRSPRQLVSPLPEMPTVQAIAAHIMKFKGADDIEVQNQNVD